MALWLPPQSDLALSAREPALLVPGLVPNVPVRIARKWMQHNPILVVCPQVARDSSFNNLRDLSTPGVLFSTTGNATTANPYRWRLSGLHSEIHPGGGTNGMSGPIKSYTMPFSTPDMTCFVFGIFQALNFSNGRFFGMYGAGFPLNDSIRLGLEDTTTLRASFIDGASPSQVNSDVTIPTVSTGGVFRIGFVKRGATIRVFARQNETLFGGVAANDNADYRGGVDANLTLGGFGNDGHYLQRLTIVFLSALSDAEIDFLLRDEYSIFEPDNDDPYLISTAAATAPGVPTSLLNQNLAATSFRSAWTAPA
jgi:hypothetical protein